MKKVFISQPMKNKTTEQIQKERIYFLNKLKDLIGEDFDVLDSIFEDFEGSTPLKYLAKSIMMLADADVIVFMPGWDSSRGCIIEHECAKRYGITIIEM